MSAELAHNPDSLVFLDLGEALRRRGQLYSAAKAAVTGLEKHPDSADAYDLYARVLVDMGHLQQAYEEWHSTVALDPQHLGAHKGLGFLCYRWGDLDGALEHLESALAADPMDQSVMYLATLADMHGGEGSPTAAALLTGDESMADILKIAIELEKKSILFYLGVKDMVPAKLGKDSIDHIIDEEKGHVVLLSKELHAVRAG